MEELERIEKKFENWWCLGFKNFTNHFLFSINYLTKGIPPTAKISSKLQEFLL